MTRAEPGIRAPGPARLDTTTLLENAAMSDGRLPVDPAPVNVLELALSFLRDGTLGIDDQGRIWRHKEAGRPISARRAENAGNKGYLRLTLGIPGQTRTKCVQAHRVIWTWFRGPIPDGLQINHEDLDKTNNRLDNLELVDASGNIRHSYANGRPHPWYKASSWRGKPRVTEDQKREIRALKTSGVPGPEIARRFGLGNSHIYRICNEKGG
jgi:hypothetical protein